MVEGDAENILIPAIADILGYPLEKYGISIVNVGSTAFLRYSRIMERKDGNDIGIPVSVVTDCDIKPEYNTDPVTRSEEFNAKETQSVQKQEEKIVSIQQVLSEDLLHLDGRSNIASP